MKINVEQHFQFCYRLQSSNDITSGVGIYVVYSTMNGIDKITRIGHIIYLLFTKCFFFVDRNMSEANFRSDTTEHTIFSVALMI